MSKKVNVDKVMDDIVYIQNQIDGLNMLLVQKKQTMAKYFEASGEKSISNDDCTVYVQERTTVDYDVDAIMDAVPKDLTDQFINKSYEIRDWKQFVAFMKKHGISGKDLKPYISVFREVDKHALSKLYEQKKISINDLEGCYDVHVTKSVALRLKDAKREISLT